MCYWIAKLTKKVFLLLCLCVWGCGDEVFSPQVLEIVSPAEPVVSAPPESVWDGIRLNQQDFPREAGFEAEQRAFYTKYVDADGIAILSDARVADAHLIEARAVVLTMTARYPALRERLRGQHGFYLILYASATGHDDKSDIPELYNAREGYYYEKNTCRMVIGRWGDKNVKGYCTASVNQEHLGRMSTLTHEFAHALDSEMERLSPGFWDRVKEAYQVAKASDAYLNLWDPYIITENSREYWAEGVVIWFYGIGADREFETYEAFAAVDPLLYDLLSEWFYQGVFPRTPIPGVPQYDLMWEGVFSK